MHVSITVQLRAPIGLIFINEKSLLSKGISLQHQHMFC